MWGIVTSGDYQDERGGWVGCVGGRGLWGVLDSGDNDTERFITAKWNNLTHEWFS